MVAFSLAFLAGQLLSPFLRVGSEVAAASLFPWFFTGKAARLEPAARCLTALLLGTWIASRAIEPPRGCYLPTLAEKTWIVGEVAASPQRTPDGLRLRLRARRDGDPQPICGDLLLTVVGSVERPGVGDRVRAHTRLRRPRNFQNPGAWDYAGALARRGVWVTGRADGDDFRRLETGASGIERRLDDERRRVATLIDEALPEPEASLARALAVGDESSVPRETWDAVAAAGLAHLLSVSGLHIAVVWAAVFVPTRWLLARSEWLLLHGNVQALAASVAAGPAIAYGALAGGSLPTERSLAMALLPLCALLCGREAEARRVLAESALVLSVVHPGCPLDISFQLSFASVLALVEGARRLPAAATASSAIGKLSGYALGAAQLSACALAATAPLVAYHFNRVTPVGLITNPVLVPLAGTPATILGLLAAGLSTFSEPAARVAFAFERWPLELLLAGVDWAARLPLAAARVPTPTLAELALAYAAFALPLLPRRRRWALAWLVIALADGGYWVNERWLSHDLRIRFLDVGQGDAAIAELPGGRVMVIDGGGLTASRFDVGERVVAPYLWSRKILHVDVLVASHGDWDHQGGLHFLAREFSPRELWFPEAEAARLTDLRREVEAAGGRALPLRRGDRKDLGSGILAACLHPPAAGVRSSNDASLVLRLELGAVSFLFPGDVERTAEDEFVPSAAAVTVLKVPHHGSRTSSREATLSALAPRLAVISAGLGNPFGFPHPEVLARYRRLGIRVLRIDLDGSVWVRTDGRELSMRAFASPASSLCSPFAALC